MEMSKPYYIVTLIIQVDDEDHLRQAAAARAVNDGLSIAEWADIRGSVRGDLIMLLDPGTLAGCSIQESTAAECT